MIDGKIISAFAPTVPMWEVYYDQDEYILARSWPLRL